jgi:hypothetical protein
MLRLVAAQAETLWDEALPIEVRELPEDLAALDAPVVRSGADDGVRRSIGIAKRSCRACRLQVTDVRRSRSSPTCG